MNILSVTQLNGYIKAVIEENQNLKRVYVQGEISNFTNHRQTGHWYFSLKDNKSQIKCVMFSSMARRIKFSPENGLKVLIKAKTTVYEPSGQYQLVADDMQPDGLGALNLAYEQLKLKLEKEGLFRQELKKQLPKYPQKIGIITSPTGAAIEDMLRILKLRWPLSQIIFCPCTVQGVTAPTQLVNSLKTLEKYEEIDVIILGRGGGSTEDLWAFNDENLARAIFACKVPTISAVGHETDFSISDFVADFRAATPSVAAQVAVPNLQDEMDNLLSLWDTMNYLQMRKIDDYSIMLDNISDIEGFTKNALNIKENNLKSTIRELEFCEKNYMQKQMMDFTKLSEKLDALSPLKVLTRGFAIVEKENILVNSIKQVEIGEEVSATLVDGKIKLKVIEVKGN
ncbi:MAG: exodeoxyribonuclease VII large subunit [Clostridia bacterium]